MKVGSDAAALDLSDALDRQENYGSDPAIQTIAMDHIKIIHRGKFATLCMDWCNGAKARQYFWVLENGFEANYPTSYGCIPPNIICQGEDHIAKHYYDRGIYVKAKRLLCPGYPDFVASICVTGPPSVHAGAVKQVCLCVDCCDCWNNWTSGYCPWCCGERIMFVPAEKACMCIPLRACWCHNCFSLCGPKNGEPLFFVPLATHLNNGEAAKLAHQLDGTRSEWSQRTGKA